MPIQVSTLEAVAYELNRRAAIAVPLDAREAFQCAADRETNTLAKRVLLSIVENAAVAVADDRPMCGDTGLPRYYVKAGNDAHIEGGFVALERTLRAVTARVTQDVKLRSNRVHPLTRRNPGNNVGVFAPNIDYHFEPDGAWIDITAVHKGGLFGSDYRMLFPGDGIPGIKRFFVDSLASFNHRGLSCPPLIVGVGIGGTKDQCFTLGKEAACLRLIGDRHPDPVVAALEQELLDLGNKTMIGVMGLRSDTPVLDVHCEIAYAHTGGTPVGISQLCHAVRRATVRIYNDGRFEFREDPEWFTPYSRREGIDWNGDEAASPELSQAAATSRVRRLIPLTPVDATGAAATAGSVAVELARGPTFAEREAALAEAVGGAAVAGHLGTNGHASSGSDGPASSAPPAIPTVPGTPALSEGEVREFHLTVPLSEADVRQLRVGDIVYLSGQIFTARDGVYGHMLGKDNEPPIDIRNKYNVTMQSAPAGVEVRPGEFEIASLQATAGFRYGQWMEALCSRYGVRAVIGKGGMSEDIYRNVFKKYGVVCLSTLGYGIGAVYGRAVKSVPAVYWKDILGISEAMWIMELDRLGPLLVEGDTEGNSFFSQHAAELDVSLLSAYEGLPKPILSRLGEVSDPTRELIS